MTDTTKPVATLAEQLSILSDGRDIIFRYSAIRGMALKWTVWDDRGSDKGQLGAGESLTAAIQSAFTNITRDMFKAGGSDLA